MIKISGLKKNYHQKLVLNVPDLSIGKGQIFGIVGNNGAGKTTFFRLLLDLIKPSEGSVMIAGDNVNRSENWKNITGSFLDDGFLIPHLSPEEYFGFVAKTRGLSSELLNMQLDSLSPLFKGEILGTGKYIRDLSQGNRNKVGIAAALIGMPKLLVLDEPFANLDPSSQFILKSQLKTINKNSGVTLLISSHNLTHIEEVCTRIAILDRGIIIRDIIKNSETEKELRDFFSGDLPA
ncbi:MAG: ABC transporter ATP-binding protein [Saprospirales bacterium]|nr:MAG: ABC transporter ATP-binding protein [Saprospirales bacterium]